MTVSRKLKLKKLKNILMGNRILAPVTEIWSKNTWI